jgi:hypothetical protein
MRNVDGLALKAPATERAYLTRFRDRDALGRQWNADPSRIRAAPAASPDMALLSYLAALRAGEDFQDFAYLQGNILAGQLHDDDLLKTAGAFAAERREIIEVDVAIAEQDLRHGPQRIQILGIPLPER